MSFELVTTGGGQGEVLIRGPFTAWGKVARGDGRGEEEKRRRGGVRGNECVKG